MNCLPVMYNRDRYGDYYLVADEPMDDVGFDERQKKCCTRRSKIIILALFITLALLVFIIVYVVFPIVFMFSIEVQRMLIFTRFDQSTNKTDYQEYKFPSYKNEYFNYTNDDNSTMSLGTWHILPVPLSYKALHNKKFDFDKALSNSNFSILIYFHGTGETRISNPRKYQLLTQLFNVIAFDYRSYGDSKSGQLTEKGVVWDCIELCLWIKNRTDAPIYLWGHSLGSALAAETAAYLNKEKSFNLSGLVLESAFTSLREEFYVHPYGKLFSWLPWFKLTVLNPLRKNNFIFDTAINIKNLTCPIMILHAEDDCIVPVKFGRKLYDIASHRILNGTNHTVYHEFSKDLDYNHIFIYQDPFLLYYIMDFMLLT